MGVPLSLFHGHRKTDSSPPVGSRDMARKPHEQVVQCTFFCYRNRSLKSIRNSARFLWSFFTLSSVRAGR